MVRQKEKKTQTNKQVSKQASKQTNKQTNKKKKTNTQNKQASKQANKKTNKQTNKQTNKTIEVGPPIPKSLLCHSTFPSHFPPSQGLLMGSLQLSVVFSVGDSLGGSSSYCTLISNVVKNDQVLSYFASFRRGIGNWWQVRLPGSCFHIATVFCNFNYICDSPR